MSPDSSSTVAGASHGGVASPMIWINGLSMAPDVMHLSAFDRGFTLADGVFETMRVYDGVVFRLDHHLRRLGGATTALGIGLRSDVGRTVAAAVGAVEDSE